MARPSKYFSHWPSLSLRPSRRPPRPTLASGPCPTRPPTIQAAIDSCVSGDVVLVFPGTYTDCTHLNGNNVAHIGILTPGVSIQGATGDPDDVILDAGGLGRCLEIRNATGDVNIEGLTLRGAQASNPVGSGGAVFVFQSDPAFRQCVFDSNNADYAGGAIAVSHGSLIVEDCVFLGNGTENIGGAIRATSSPVTVTGSTFHGTHGEAIHYSVDDLTLENCLITGGDEEAVVRNLSSDPAPSLHCCNIWGNDEDYSSFFSDLLGTDGNISLDPLYCNPVSGHLHLYAASACAAENNTTCGQIGALDVSCGSGAVTWVVAADSSGDAPTIQDALNAAADGDTIALADGTFRGEGNRDLDFLGKGVVLIGQSRDPELAIIDCQGSQADPHRGVHFTRVESAYATLCDLTIMNGDAGSGDGGAVLCESDVTITGCILRNNHAERGAGLFCDHASPTINDCVFMANEGRSRAGGIGLLVSEATVTDCVFVRNWGYMGGALFLPDSSSVTITGCTLAYNASSVDKACIGVDGTSYLNLQNSVVAFNTRRAVRCYAGGSVTAADCDVYGNPEGNYTSCLSGDLGEDGNISADPLFCDGAADDYQLRGDSPCTDYNAPGLEQIGAYGMGCAAPAVFADASAALPVAGARGYGVAWVDLQGDGHLDAFVAGRQDPNRVYLGDGAGGFTSGDEPALLNAPTTLTSAWADLDNDGDYDTYAGSDHQINLLLINDGGTFTYLLDSDLSNLGPAGGSGWADYDRDGYLDLFLAAPDSSSALLKGDGSGNFTPVASFPGEETGLCRTAVWGDYDNDGDQDLYVVCDGQANQLLENDGAFSEDTGAGVDNAGSGRSAVWGDYDNDGDLDLYLVNAGGGNKLYQNDGDGDFTDVTAGSLGDTGPGSSAAWGDWDNDGDLDLLLANDGTADRLLRNDGDEVFVDVAEPQMAAADSTVGTAWGDYDADGDLDLLLTRRDGGTRLLRNDVASGHWLKIDLVRASGQVGCPGARLYASVGDSLHQMREVSGGGGLSQSAVTVHFGLGSAASVDSLHVVWPSGAEQILHDVTADQTLMLDEAAATPVLDDLDGSQLPTRSRLAGGVPNPFNPTTAFRFTLAESGPVSVKIYDVAGRRVRVLVDEVRPAGSYTAVWRGRDDSGRTAAAGVYFCRMTAGRFRQTQPVTLLK